MKLISNEEDELNYAYNTKMNSLIGWYNENIILRNRLLLLVEGSDNLRSIFLNSSVVNFHSVSHYNKYNIILTHNTFGLFQICFCTDKVDNRIHLKPFEGFILPPHSYLIAKPYDNHKNWELRNVDIFDWTDISILRKMFEFDLEPAKSLMEDIITSQKDLINFKIREFIQSGSLEPVEHKDEFPMFESSDILFEKFKKETQDNFLERYSKEIYKAIHFQATLEAVVF